MNVHRVRERGERRVGVHGAEDAVNRFVSASAEDGRSEDFFAFDVDKDLHQAL